MASSDFWTINSSEVKVKFATWQDDWAADFWWWWRVSVSPKVWQSIRLKKFSKTAVSFGEMTFWILLMFRFIMILRQRSARLIHILIDLFQGQPCPFSVWQPVGEDTIILVKKGRFASCSLARVISPVNMCRVPWRTVSKGKLNHPLIDPETCQCQ